MNDMQVREEGTLKKFIMITTALSIFLVLLWAAFFFLTMKNVKENAIVQADAEAEAIMSRIEDELQTIDETLYGLSHYLPLIEMIKKDDRQLFFDLGGEVADSVNDLIGLDHPASIVAVVQTDGDFYRLRGTISNTAMLRIAHMLAQGERNSFYVTTNDMTYIGSVRTVFDHGKEAGHVVLLMEKTRLEYIFSDYAAIDYMGIVLSSKDRILCANREVKFENLDEIRSDSFICKEKTIGLTGLTLFVYAKKEISAKLQGYFLIALPVTILILCCVMTFFVHYWRRKMLEPQEREILETKMRAQQAEIEKERTLMKMLKKQIGAHFTVNTMNVVRALISRGDRDKAIQMCDEMSCLMRYANVPEEYISLMEEFYILEQYVEIMKVRYPNRFSYEAEIDDDFSDIAIPRMLLQPIVENAILYAKASKITVTVQKGEQLRICVADNGLGMTNEKLEELRQRIKEASIQNDPAGIKGIALVNIHKRIQIVYGNAYGIRIESKEGKGTKVWLELR